MPLPYTVATMENGDGAGRRLTHTGFLSNFTSAANEHAHLLEIQFTYRIRRRPIRRRRHYGADSPKRCRYYYTPKIRSPDNAAAVAWRRRPHTNEFIPSAPPRKFYEMDGHDMLMPPSLLPAAE